FLHLWIMGTIPKSKGKGIGTKLLKEVLEYYGKTKPIYLETTTESNMHFYKKLGFKVFNETYALEYPLYFLLRS
ncbi:GNAT family N-acetyltransferase, partial [Aquimarina celericrescens]|nr:GNAT family N-acetyltransferase [Aquimarina celericrescens]